VPETITLTTRLYIVIHLLQFVGYKIPSSPQNPEAVPEVKVRGGSSFLLK